MRMDMVVIIITVEQPRVNGSDQGGSGRKLILAAVVMGVW